LESINTESENDALVFPREFKHYFSSLDQDELSLIREALLKDSSLEVCNYITFCKKTIEVTLTSGQNTPNLDYLAANIACEIRKLDDLENIANKSNNIFVLIPLIRGLVAKNSLDRAAANIQIIENKITPDDFVYQIELNIAKCTHLFAMGKLTDALFQLLTAKESLSSYNDQIEISYHNALLAEVLVHECKILLAMGRHDKIYDELNNGLSLAKKIGNQVLITLLELYYGDYLIEFKDDVKTGNQYHRRAAAKAKKIMNPYLIAITLETIGSNLKMQENLEEGIKFCMHAERLYNNIGDEQARMLVAIKIADLQIAFGNFSAAIKLLLELENFGSNNPYTFLNLVKAFIKTDDLDLAENYLEKGRKYLRGRGDLPGEFLLIYYEGLIEFQSGNFSKAEYLFTNAQEFAELSQLSKQTLHASLQLVNVLVSKNIALPSKRNFKKAKFAIMELSSQIKTDDLSQEYNELELLKAILLFSNKTFHEAKKIFKKLETYYLRIKLFNQLNVTQDYLNRINHYEFIGFITEQKTEPVSVFAYEATMKPPSKPRVDPSSTFIDLGANPILLLILSQGGLPLFSHYFTEGFGKIDETLVSGFLGAVVSFTEMLGENTTRNPRRKRGFLQGIRHGDFEILLERSEKYIIALVADKENYLLRKQLKRLAEEINVLFLLDDEPIIVLGEKNRYFLQSVINRIF